MNEFLKILEKIDILYIVDIFSAGEKSIKNIKSQVIVNKLKKKRKNIYYIGKNANLKLILKPYFNDSNNIIFMGAGSITLMAHNLLKK